MASYLGEETGWVCSQCLQSNTESILRCVGCGYELPELSLQEEISQRLGYINDRAGVTGSCAAEMAMDLYCGTSSVNKVASTLVTNGLSDLQARQVANEVYTLRFKDKHSIISGIIWSGVAMMTLGAIMAASSLIENSDSIIMPTGVFAAGACLFVAGLRIG